MDIQRDPNQEILTQIIETMRITEVPFVIGFVKEDGDSVSFVLRNLSPESALVVLDAIKEKITEDNKVVVTH